MRVTEVFEVTEVVVTGKVAEVAPAATVTEAWTEALALLEAAYWRIGGALGTYPPNVITVVLYTERQFQDITQSPGWAAGLYDGRIKVPVRGALEHPEEFERALRVGVVGRELRRLLDHRQPGLDLAARHQPRRKVVPPRVVEQRLVRHARQQRSQLVEVARAADGPAAAVAEHEVAEPEALKDKGGEPGGKALVAPFR